MMLLNCIALNQEVFFMSKGGNSIYSPIKMEREKDDKEGQGFRWRRSGKETPGEEEE